MAKYKTCDYAQTMLVAVSLADQLQAGTMEHTIHYVVEERLDLTGFDQERSNDSTGRPGYDPRVLLKVVLLGYARGMLSSRKLDRNKWGQLLGVNIRPHTPADRTADHGAQAAIGKSGCLPPCD